ncbi:MAG: DegT/DnrJ/EryC1/StrS family aminotransferase [Bacteroidales bacterium]|nr:DegT/DnrJ/EryC1/StrS family aminotransferase [Bacteroidales bacterium]
MHIPFVDLHIQYLSIKKEIDAAINDVIRNSSFIKGNHVLDFEKAFAKKHDIKHCIGVGNGTDAIYIVLKMLGIGEGDEVITTALSWISTSEAISQTGAKPVFVDIEKDYFTISVLKINEKINSRTKAILPVHLYGQCARIDEIKKICEKNNLFLIEDCAQAHFAEHNKQKAGTSGIASTFSFFPGKNLGAYGDGGAIITNDDELAIKCRMYANHGALEKHKHQIEGINSRLDGIHAAILNVKLKYIDKWNNNRLKNALHYNKLLSGIPEIKIPQIRENAKHIFHIYCIRAEKRDELKNFLLKNKVDAAIHYPTALPLLPAYKRFNFIDSDYPVASGYTQKILSLPMFPELSKKQIEFVASLIKKFYHS